MSDLRQVRVARMFGLVMLLIQLRLASIFVEGAWSEVAVVPEWLNDLWLRRLAWLKPALWQERSFARLVLAAAVLCSAIVLWLVGAGVMRFWHAWRGDEA